MTATLDTTEAHTKIDRARELHGELAAAVSEWRDTGGVQAQSRRALQYACYIGYAKVNTAPPINLPMRAGEVLHALRSALDYTAFQIYLANGGTPDGEMAHTVQFPVVTDPARWIESWRARSTTLGPPRSPNFVPCNSSRRRQATRLRRCRPSIHSCPGWRR
jgi:hypothetical protein